MPDSINIKVGKVIAELEYTVLLLDFVAQSEFATLFSGESICQSFVYMGHITHDRRASGGWVLESPDWSNLAR